MAVLIRGLREAMDEDDDALGLRYGLLIDVG